MGGPVPEGPLGQTTPPRPMFRGPRPVRLEGRLFGSRTGPGRRTVPDAAVRGPGGVDGLKTDPGGIPD